MKHSFRRQLVILVLAVLAVSLLLIGLFNIVFLDDYYEDHKIDTIIDAYYAIDVSKEKIGEEAFSDEVIQLCARGNLQCSITDENFETLFTTFPMPDEMALRLFGYYTGLYRDSVEQIRTEDVFTIQKTRGFDGLTYLELWGNLSSGSFILIRTPMESIREGALLSTRFFVIIGLIVTAIAVLATSLLSKRFTTPLERLREVARSISTLSFEEKYTVRENGNEIDELGSYMNEVSDTLSRSVSELKSANAALQKDVEHRVKIDEMRLEFLNNVSHELKTPISIIQGYAEGLKEGICEDPESREYYLDVIMDESAKMNQLVMQLLSLNKLEYGQEALTYTRFDLIESIQGVIRNMDILIKQKDARIYFDDSKPVFVYGDEFRIEEVITNYLSNALHHLEGEKKIDIRVESLGNRVKTTVFNTGERIPEEDLPHIWEKFYKVDKARSREYGGTGIGLSIVKAIIEAHGTECDVKNYENGVAFTFTLEAR